MRDLQAEGWNGGFGEPAAMRIDDRRRIYLLRLCCLLEQIDG
jgi:hypothetical protein